MQAIYIQHRMKVQIAGVEFMTKKIAKSHVMNVVNRLIGESVSAGEEHFDLLWSLWERSPLFEDGGDYFLIGQKFDGPAIKTVTREGKVIDWSIRGAVSGKDICVWSKLISAMRWAVRPHIVRFKDLQAGGCERCGSFRHLEVDHIYRFRDLMLEYLESKNNMYPELYQYTHNGHCFRSEDADFEAGWATFHNSRCKLRLLCSDCHRIITEAQREEK